MLCVSTSVFSQAGQKWSTSGNANASGDFMGSTNNQPLIFKTNNNQQGMFTTSGNFQLTSLKGMGFNLLQTDASGIISKFPMSSANEVLFGDGTWRPLPTPPPSTWELNGTNLYYLNGKVGIGTKTPLTNFDVIGDAYISNNLYVGGGIIITEKVRANVEVLTSSLKADVEVLTAALRADSIVMDSTKGIYGYSIFKDRVRLENKLQVVGNTQIDGNFRVNGDFIFGDNKRIGYLPASGGNPEIISFGKLPNTGVYQLLRSACNFPAAPTSYQVEGMINAYGNSVYGGNLNVLSMGFDGANGIIDMAGTSTGVEPRLLINYYCGKDIFMNTGANGGNVIMTTSTLGNVGIGTDNPTAKLDVNGNVNISTNATQITKSFVVKDIISGLDVFRIMGDGQVWATEVNVDLAADFPDYVFTPDYFLMPLDQLESYIEQNKHLPNIPAAKEIKENGLELGKMQIKQMEKIEELTLYLIEIKKELEILKLENKKLKEMMIKH